MAQKYKKRKDGRYYTSIPSGKYDEKGKPILIHLYATTSGKLEEKVFETKLKLKQGDVLVPDKISVSDYADRWFKLYKSNRSLYTQALYRKTIKAHIKPCIGDILMCKLVKSDVQGMINSLSDRPSTAHIVKLTMKQICETAIEDDILKKNVCNKLEMPLYKAPEKRALTDYEKKAIFKVELSAQDRCLLYLLYGCGLRREEVFALQKESFDMKNRLVKISQTVVFDGNNPILKHSAKSKSGIRNVPIPKDLADTIISYVNSLSDGDFLFSHNNGMVTMSSAWVRWERIVRALQKVSNEPIKGLTMHIFRHNYATMLYYSGISIKKAADLLGHSDINMIMKVYAHLDENQENTVEKLDSVIKLI